MVKKFIQSLFGIFNYQIIRKSKPHFLSKIDIFLIICKILFERRGKDVFVLQIGANDGIRADPVRPLLEMFQWRALLVEPQPAMFSLLKKNYNNFENIQFENAFISDRELKSQTLFTIRQDLNIDNWERLTGLARSDKKSFVKELESMGIINPEKIIDSIEVPCMTFDNLVKKYNINIINILVIDAEGYDFKIFKQIDLQKFRINIILIEFFHLSMNERIDLVKKLESYNYVVSFVLGDIVAALDVPRA